MKLPKTSATKGWCISVGMCYACLCHCHPGKTVSPHHLDLHLLHSLHHSIFDFEDVNELDVTTVISDINVFF